MGAETEASSESIACAADGLADALAGTADHGNRIYNAHSAFDRLVQALHHQVDRLVRLDLAQQDALETGQDDG